MKKSLFVLLAATGLLSTSCSQEPFYPNTPEEILAHINDRFDFNSHIVPTISVNAGKLSYITVYDDDPQTNPGANPIISFTTDYYGGYDSKFEVGSSLVGRDLYAISREGDIKMKGRLTAKGVTFSNSDAQMSRSAYIAPNNKNVCKVLNDYFHILLPAGNNANLDKVQEACQDVNIKTLGDTEIAISMTDYGDHFKNQIYYYYIPSSAKITDYTQKYIYDTFCNSKFLITPSNASNWNMIDNNTNANFAKTTDLHYYGSDYNGESGTVFPSGVQVGFFIRIWVYDNIFGADKNVPMGHYIIFNDAVGSLWEDDFKTNNTTDWTLSKRTFTKTDDYHAAAFRANESSSWPEGISGSFSNPDDPSKKVTRVMYGFEDSLGYKSDSDFDDIMFMATIEGSIDDNITPFLNEGESYWYGTYLFEDLYPESGDYDLNDVVVRYFFYLHYTEEIINEETNERKNKIDHFAFGITPYHNGAKYVNDFWLSYVLPDGTVPEDMTTVIYQNNKVQDFEADQLRAYVGGARYKHIVVPDVPNATVATGWGDRGASAFGTSMLTKVKYFTEGAFWNYTVTNEQGVTVNRGINPFIYCTDTEHQVHLTKFEFSVDGPGIAPADDYEKYYLVNIYDKDNNRDLLEMPFAADIASRTDYVPAPEKMPIYLAYPDFVSWASSKNRASTSWIDNPTTSYPWEDWGPIE